MAARNGPVEFRILGPLEVVEGGETLQLGGPKQRALLAMLLLHAGEAVSTDRLIEALWRGAALADFTYESFAQTAIARLEELRLITREDRLDAELALGRHTELLGELEALVTEHPLRERCRAQLMIALYRSGRQADALH